MYDVEKRSAVLEDAAGFARRDAYRVLGNFRETKLSRISRMT